jgi:hypothetical protein
MPFPAGKPQWDRWPVLADIYRSDNGRGKGQMAFMIGAWSLMTGKKIPFQMALHGKGINRHTDVTSTRNGDNASGKAIKKIRIP